MIAPLTFENLVSDSFDFLSTNFGFSQYSSARAYLVRYQHGDVFVDVIYDPLRSHELGILVGRDGDNAPAFELAEVLRAFGCPEEAVRKVDLVQTTDEEVLKRLLRECANLFRSYGDRILRGDTTTFSELAQSRATSSEAYTRRIMLDQVDKSVEAAWESKNYYDVVRILAPHRSNLDQRLLRRLSFAEQKVLSGGGKGAKVN